MARAREAARLDGRVCSDDGLLECLAGLDDDEPGPSATVDDDVERLREASTRRYRARGPRRLPTSQKSDDVADLLSRAGGPRGPRRAGPRRRVGRSATVPDYDDDSVNDEPTDSESEDEDDDR